MGMAIQRPSFMPYLMQASSQPPYLAPRYSATSVTSTSLSGYRCGSSCQPETRSGPAPTAADMAALGRTSSQETYSLTTLQPVTFSHLRQLASQRSLSPPTKTLHLRTFRVAPFSTARLGGVAASALPASGPKGLASIA